MFTFPYNQISSKFRLTVMFCGHTLLFTAVEVKLKLLSPGFILNVVPSRIVPPVEFINLKDMSPVIVQLHPVNNSNSSTNTITFSANISDNILLVNSSFYLNGNINQTNTSLINGTTWNVTLTLSDGTYDWFYDAWDNTSQQTNGTGMRFSIDTISPKVNVSFPNETIDFHEFNTNLSICLLV